MNKILEFINKIIKVIGTSSAWLNVILVLLLCIDVSMRYLLNLSFNWVIELEWHIFGLIFLLNSAYTYQKDKHVRVDIFYHDFSDKKKALVNLFGNIFFLLPWCIIAIHTCTKYAANSFYIKENSPNPGGLPAMYIIKSFMVLGFILLLLQGLILIIQQIKTLVK